MQVDDIEMSRRKKLHCPSEPTLVVVVKSVVAVRIAVVKDQTRIKSTNHRNNNSKS